MRNFILFLLLLCCSTLSAQDKDAQMLRYFNSQQHMHEFSKVISNSAYVVTIGTPLVQGITALATQNDKLLKEAISTTIGLGLNTMLTSGLKYSIQRPRPYITYPTYIQNVTSESSPAFPSGHTSIAFCTATSLSLQYTKWYVIVPSYIWACGVGYSRMNLGVHYPTDVLAGAILGAGSAYLTHKINQLLWHKLDNKKLIGLQVYKQPLPTVYTPE